LFGPFGRGTFLALVRRGPLITGSAGTGSIGFFSAGRIFSGILIQQHLMPPFHLIASLIRNLFCHFTSV
jgi:hypothetical protein